MDKVPGKMYFVTVIIMLFLVMLPPIVAYSTGDASSDIIQGYRIAGPIIVGAMSLGGEVNSVYVDTSTGSLLVRSSDALVVIDGSSMAYTLIEPIGDGYMLFDYEDGVIVYGNSTVLWMYNISSMTSTVIYTVVRGYNIVSASVDPALDTLVVALGNGIIEVRSLSDSVLKSRKILGYSVERLELQHGIMVTYGRGSVSIYNLDLQYIASIPVPDTSTAHVLVSPTGAGMAVALEDSVRVYNRYGSLLYVVNGDSPLPAWSPEGDMLLVVYSSSDLLYSVLYTLEGEPVNAVESSIGPIVGLSWSKYIVLVGQDGIIYYLQTWTASEWMPYSVTSLAWSPFSDHLVAGYHNSVSIVDSSLNPAWTIELPYRVLDVADDPSYIVVATSNGTYIIDHLGNMTCIVDTGLTQAITPLGEGIFAFTGVETGIIDAGSCSVIRTFDVPRGFVGTGIVGSLDDSMIVVLGVNGIILVFDQNTGYLVAEASVNSSTNDLAYSPARGMIAIALTKGLVLLDYHTLASLGSYLEGIDVAAVTLDPSGYMAGIITLGRPLLLDLTGELTIPVNVPYARSLAWSPNGMYIAVGYDAGVALVEATAGVGEGLELSPVVKPLVVASRNVTQLVTETVTETVMVTETIQAEPVVETVVVTETVTETVTKTVVEKETVVVENVTTVTVVREVSPLDSLGSWYEDLRQEARDYGVDLDTMVTGLSLLVITLLIIVFMVKSSKAKPK